MFLEPLYLHEKMLLNCASYLFGGVVLNKEKTTKNAKGNDTKGNISGGGKFGIDLFSNMVNSNADLVLEHNRNNNSSTETKIASQIALGAIHQSVVEELEDRKYIQNLSPTTLSDYEDNNTYIKIKASLVPVDYFDILQIFKMVVPQLENFFNLFESYFVNTSENEDIENEDTEIKQNIINSLSIITSLVDQLEKTYLESNQLEMLIQDINGNTVGVIDIELLDKSIDTGLNPNEIKAKLTDGSFVIFGKVTKYVDVNGTINLLERSLLSTIFEKIEVVLKFYDSQFAEVEDNQSGEEVWDNMKKLVRPLLDSLFMYQIKGHAIRVKAMSVCI